VLLTALCHGPAYAAAADAVLLHISYLRTGAPGVASGADLLGALQQIGIRVYVYGCDMVSPCAAAAAVVLNPCLTTKARAVLAGC
jgi:hypothetical protein